MWLAASVPGLVNAQELWSDSEWAEWAARPVLRGQEASPYDEPLATDRPDFTEASNTVGLGVLQIESGYTYIYDDDGALFHGHSGPELLFRYGITDMIELRFVWNYLWESERIGGVTEHTDGAEDFSVGTKTALTSQCGWIPESALITALSTPTGANAFSNENTEIELNYLYSWDVSEELSLAGSAGYSTAGERVTIGVVPVLDRFNVFHKSVAVGLPVTEDVGFYLEYFGLYPDGAFASLPENYIDGGFTYLLNYDVQFDIRAGVGLNDAADDFFAGAGLSVRL